VDAVKEQYYPVGNYEDQYMRWTDTVAREGPRSFRVHQYLPYLAHQDGYQRLWMTFGSEISWGSTQIHPNWNGFSGYLITRCCYRYGVKIEQKFKHQNKWEFRYENSQQSKYEKDGPNKQLPEN
jgi:hypothetical protein